MNMMEDFSLLCQVCSLSFSLFSSVFNNISFQFFIGCYLPLYTLPANGLQLRAFSKHFCCVHLFKSELDELPGRPAAIPCNVRESLQPVNQLEAGMADESAGVLLPFLHGGILSYFLLIFLSSEPFLNISAVYICLNLN